MPEITALNIDPSGGSSGDALAGQDEIGVINARSVEEAARTLRRAEVDCVVTEYDLGEVTGIALAGEVRRRWPDTGVVLFTAEERERLSRTNGDALLEYVPKDATDAEGRLVEVVRTTASRRCQTAYPLRGDEPERLEVVSRLNTMSEDLRDTMERVSDEASSKLQTSAAAVTVLRERDQTVIGSAGIQLDALDRQETVCTYTILEDGVTLVEDLTDDPRFEANDTLERFGVRSYAGWPLNVDGHSVGTVCVYDDEPRVFTEEEVDYLGLLAEDASAWLEQLSGDGESTGNVGYPV